MVEQIVDVCVPLFREKTVGVVKVTPHHERVSSRAVEHIWDVAVPTKEKELVKENIDVARITPHENLNQERVIDDDVSLSVKVTEAAVDAKIIPRKRVQGCTVREIVNLSVLQITELLAETAKTTSQERFPTP